MDPTAPMESTESTEAGEPTAQRPPRRARRGILIGVSVALVALLVLGATAVTAQRNEKRFAGGAFAGHAFGMPNDAPGNDKPRGPWGDGRGMPGLQGVVTAVDASAKTIILAGIPGVPTVTADANLKLTAAQADGTTKPAALADFKAGQVVRVHGTIDRSQIPQGQKPDPSKIKLTVTEITALPSGVVRGFGLVTAVNGSTFTVQAMGGLTLTVNGSAAKVTKGRDNAAASAGDIKVGDRISFTGTQQGNAVNATQIGLMSGGFPFGPGGFGGPGKPGGPGGRGPRP